MQFCGNLLIPETAADELYHLMFPLGKRCDLPFLGIWFLPPAESLLKHTLRCGLLQPHSAIGYFSNCHRNLLNGPLPLKYALGPTTQCSLKKSSVVAARHNDHARLLDLCDQLFKSIEFIAKNLPANKQHVRRVIPNCIQKALFILTFGKHPDISLMSNRAPHPSERERLIVGYDYINIGHTPHPCFPL